MSKARPPDPITITAAVIVLVAGVGLSVAAGYLLKPKLKTPLRDDNPVTLAERGSTMPYVIGRRRVGAVIAYVGHEIMSHASAGGKGGGGGHTSFFGGGSASKPPIFIEEGWHLVAVGPVAKLHRIFVSGKVVFGPEVGSGPIDHVGFPSGSMLDLGPAHGSLHWYWGEEDQPPNSDLADPTRVGILSNWPLVCYAQWNKNKGQQHQWPPIEYEIETEIQDVGIDVTTSGPTVTGSSLISFVTAPPDPVETIKGVNLAHALAQLLFGRWPYGAAFDPQKWDLVALNGLAATMSAENIAGSVLCQGGENIDATIATILQDVGAFIGWDPKQGKHRLKLIRPLETDLADAPAEVQLDPLPEIEQFTAARPTDKLVFSYKDFDNGHRVHTFTIDDDGQQDQTLVQRQRKIEITCVVDFASARTIAERRSQEELASGLKYKFKSNRGTRAFFPGRAFTADGIPYLLRAVEIRTDPLKGEVEIDAVNDFYGVPASTFKAIKSTEGGIPTPPAVPADPQDDYFEVPAYILAAPEGAMALCAPRCRADKTIGSATVYISPDGTSYTEKGEEDDLQTGGTLIDSLPATGPAYIEDGPKFTVAGPDIGIALDLTPDPTSWRLGKQLVLIEDELFFCRNVHAISSTTYQLKGLLRARYDTYQKAHAVAKKVFLFIDGKILHTADAMLAPGATISMKLDPSGLGGTLDPSLAPVVGPKTLHGKGMVPMDPLNVQKDPATALTGSSPCYKTGTDLAFVWRYRSALTAKTGAGMQPYGAAALDPSAVEGTFEVKFLTTGDVLKKTVSGLAAPSYTLTHADFVAAFGGEVDFHVEVRDTKGGYKSDPAKLTVVKVA